jgi:hypothetical protein
MFSPHLIGLRFGNGSDFDFKEPLLELHLQRVIGFTDFVGGDMIALSAKPVVVMMIFESAMKPTIGMTAILALAKASIVVSPEPRFRFERGI